MKALKRSLLPIATAMMLASAASMLSPAFADEGMSEGTIKKIDAKAGKVTIKHGPLDNLSMPPMTMIFTVSDPAMLESFSAGDEIEFHAVDEGGKFIVKDMQASD